MIAAEIQPAIDAMYGQHGGGIITLPPGEYVVPGGLILKGGVILQGSGVGATQINVGDNDVNAVAFDATCFNASLRDLFIIGKRTRPVTTNCVAVARNVVANIRDCYLWYGFSGLFTQGGDGLVENCFIAGLECGIASNGANWYVRCKVDQLSTKTPKTWGFLQGCLDNNVMENHFSQCDFSGDFDYSVQINDSMDPASNTIFEGCVFSSHCDIGKSKWTTFNACEIGAAVTCNGPTSVIGCWSPTPMTIANATKAGNINIS